MMFNINTDTETKYSMSRIRSCYQALDLYLNGDLRFVVLDYLMVQSDIALDLARCCIIVTEDLFWLLKVYRKHHCYQVIIQPEVHSEGYRAQLYGAREDPDALETLQDEAISPYKLLINLAVQADNIEAIRQLQNVTKKKLPDLDFSSPTAKLMDYLAATYDETKAINYILGYANSNSTNSDTPRYFGLLLRLLERVEFPAKANTIFNILNDLSTKSFYQSYELITRYGTIIGTSRARRYLDAEFKDANVFHPVNLLKTLIAEQYNLEPRPPMQCQFYHKSGNRCPEVYRYPSNFPFCSLCMYKYAEVNNVPSNKCCYPVQIDQKIKYACTTLTCNNDQCSEHHSGLTSRYQTCSICTVPILIRSDQTLSNHDCQIEAETIPGSHLLKVAMPTLPAFIVDSDMQVYGIYDSIGTTLYRKLTTIEAQWARRLGLKL